MAQFSDEEQVEVELSRSRLRRHIFSLHREKSVWDAYEASREAANELRVAAFKLVGAKLAKYPANAEQAMFNIALACASLLALAHTKNIESEIKPPPSFPNIEWLNSAIEMSSLDIVLATLVSDKELWEAQTREPGFHTNELHMALGRAHNVIEQAIAAELICRYRTFSPPINVVSISTAFANARNLLNEVKDFMDDQDDDFSWKLEHAGTPELAFFYFIVSKYDIESDDLCLYE